eukprot:2786037-Rhodomonas_salina.2
MGDARGWRGCSQTDDARGRRREPTCDCTRWAVVFQRTVARCYQSEEGSRQRGERSGMEMGGSGIVERGLWQDLPCGALWLCDVRYGPSVWLCACYAMSGTDLVSSYALATRCPVLT